MADVEVKPVYHKWNNDQHARRHWRTYIQFEAYHKPAQTRFLMGMIHTYAGQYKKGNENRQKIKSKPGWQKFKREAVQAVLSSLEAEAGDRIIVAFGDSNIDGAD